MPPPLLPTKTGDWAYVQAQFELGEKSVPLLAKETGLAPQAIWAAATRNGWRRTENADAAAAHRAELRLATEQRDDVEVARARELAVEANTRLQARVLAAHRADIATGRNLCLQLMGEMQQMMENHHVLEELGDFMYAPNERGQDKRNAAYEYVIGFDGRVNNIKKLSDAMKNFILLERQAHGIKAELEDPEAKPPPPPTPTEDAMAAILTRIAQVMEPAPSPRDITNEVIENAANPARRS